MNFWAEVICDNLDGEAATSFRRYAGTSGVGENTVAHARVALWQLEDARLGLLRIGAVRQDTELSGLCREVADLYRKTVSGERNLDASFADLSRRANAAWAARGEAARVRLMLRARRWAWLGGRKWAWISSRAWSSSWVWLLAATRRPGYAQASLMVASWSKAWKWPRPWLSHRAKVSALGRQVLGAAN